MQTFDYGKKIFKGYICHENNYTPLPERPDVTAEQFSIAIDKTMHDLKEWRTKELRATGELWWKIFMGIAIVIVGVGIAYTLAPNFFNNLIHKGAETAVNNVTAIVNTTKNLNQDDLRNITSGVSIIK